MQLSLAKFFRDLSRAKAHARLHGGSGQLVSEKGESQRAAPSSFMPLLTYHHFVYIIIPFLTGIGAVRDRNAAANL